MRYAPYGQLGHTPNVIVDGAAQDATLLTLSHWPHSGTPSALADDLSAQIAFHYLDRAEHHVDADVVSNNHFDEDGLVGVYTLVDPDTAQARRALVVDVAAAGDFGTFESRDAARISFAISAFADRERSPLEPSIFELDYDEYCGVMYEELLPRVPELLDHSDRFRDLWRDEDAHLDASEAAIRSGEITIEEVPRLDLAIVTVPDEWRRRVVHRFTQLRSQAVHPMAIHNATNCFRVLLDEGRRYEVQFRYETWVQYVSRRPAPRVDLGPLAESLSAEERDGRWVFDGAGAITPSLRLEGSDESALPPEAFRARLEEFLATALPAWNPYDEPAPTRG
jgi:hypothetical protein